MDSCVGRLQQHAPYLYRMLQTLCGVSGVEGVEGTEECVGDTRLMPGEQEEIDECPMSEGEESETENTYTTSHRRQVVRKRNKKIIATVIAHIMMFARSQKDNYLQTIIGFWLQSVKAPKRLIALLNRVGISVSYASVTTAIKAVGEAAHKSIQVRRIGDSKARATSTDTTL
jgi:uncharacterized transporter YbjL